MGGNIRAKYYWNDWSRCPSMSISVRLEASAFFSLLLSDILSNLQVPACKVNISYGWEQYLLQTEAVGCVGPMYLLNQMFKYLCRNDRCHLICWLVLSYLFVEYSIIYGEIPGGSSANATSNWICWFLKVRWKLSIIITQIMWWRHQVALNFKCKIRIYWLLLYTTTVKDEQIIKSRRLTSV